MSAAALSFVSAIPASAATVGAAAFLGQTTSGPVPLIGTPANPTYTFNSLVCAAAEADTTGAFAVEGLCVITSSGVYTNIVCGTGTASGSAAITLAHNSITVAYGITFVAGIGVMTGQADGVVVIVPTGSGLPDTSQCMTQFTVVGAIAFLSA